MSSADERDYLAYKEAANDADLRAAFSALDDLHAPEALKSRALAAALAAAGQPAPTSQPDEETKPYDVAASETIPFDVGAQLAGDAIAPEAAAAAAVTTIVTPEDVAAGTEVAPKLELVEGGAPRHSKEPVKGGRPRWQRIVAVAACAALVASVAGGGVAYATPSAEVTFGSDDGSSVQVDVNRFGHVLRGTPTGDDAVFACEGLGMNCRPFDDVACDFMGRKHRDGSGDWLSTVKIQSDDAGLVQSIKNKISEAEGRMGCEHGRFPVWRDGFEEPPNHGRPEHAVVMHPDGPHQEPGDQQPEQQQTAPTATETTTTTVVTQTQNQTITYDEPQTEQVEENPEPQSLPEGTPPHDQRTVEPERPEPTAPTEPIFAEPVPTPTPTPTPAPEPAEPTAPVRVDDPEGIVG